MNKIVLVIVILTVALVSYFIYDYSKINNESEEQTLDPAQNQNMENQAGELKIEILKEGTGAEAKNGDTVSVHYVGVLENGTKFDSSIDRGQPFSFPLGSGYVIKGWDQGVLGMKIGEKRKLIIPAELGYGSRAIGSIPPNSTLIFEVELLGIEKQ
ncbi:MAG: FKBP-type peptidyl-prolyl cis-trans isomerase [Candidatus Pacebacteria bacterium]|nr:FKBP-type peptidyl-prolyl cis-trans isomerase [Candidatus Paceibacterota bacterium]